MDTNIYRGISLLSNLATLSTSVINQRLLSCSKDNNISTYAQFGFKPGYGTRDAIFVIHGLVTKLLSNKKRLYCCFIDYAKAFDNIDRVKLWRNIIKAGVTGKVLPVIQCLYTDFKAQVKGSSIITESFDVSTGLYQGRGFRTSYFVCMLMILSPISLTMIVHRLI